MAASTSYRKLGGAGMGVVDKPETGPYFGPEG